MRQILQISLVLQCSVIAPLSLLHLNLMLNIEIY